MLNVLGLSLMFSAMPAIAAPTATPPAATTPPTATYQCTGRYQSATCTTTLYFNNCKHSIRMTWTPLQLPGTADWAKRHRNWCSVTWQAEGSVEERKFQPKKCDELLRIFAAAFQDFPEVKWQDANCNLTTSPDAILYVSQSRENPAPERAQGARDNYYNDPAPRAVLLEEARVCTLTNDKARVLHCPVLPQRVQSWLRKVLGFLSVSLVIQNPLK